MWMFKLRKEFAIGIIVLKFRWQFNKMSIVTFKTPRDPIDLVIPEFLKKASFTVRLKNSQVPRERLQDIELEYIAGQPGTHAKGILELGKLPERILIHTRYSLEEVQFLLNMYEKLKRQGYFFNDEEETCLQVHFQNGWNGDWNRFIDVNTNITEIHSAPYIGHDNYYYFDREGYIQELEKRGLERLTEQNAP